MSPPSAGVAKVFEVKTSPFMNAAETMIRVEMNGNLLFASALSNEPFSSERRIRAWSRLASEIIEVDPVCDSERRHWLWV
jgi:hypothetical protein